MNLKFNLVLHWIMRKALFILLLLISLPLSAAEKKTLFARIMPDREQVYAGDSMLVSVVLYSSAPIAKAECLTNLSVKGKCTLRKLDINRDATAGRTRYEGLIYYTLVWNQYVFAPQKAGDYTIPVQKFKATLHKIVRVPDIFDQMMGAQPEYREIKLQGESKSFTIHVTNRPLRSTREMMQGGAGVL